ncbi:MAG TPA: lysylphosphatidylglycerol synthase transmembrane domain-containing protein [Pirellulales bacterium]|nr:lysylphosphatidylglycerol synthase transmembrane domain-containing protein [Pirellulales bacterium]
MKNVLVNLLKFGLSFGILGYLIYDAVSDDTFALMMDQPKHWGCFAAAWALGMGATCLTFVRWYYLVRALDLPFTMADAFRLGFLGYLFNFVLLGSVGGDLLKAVYIAREQHGKRAEAVATVVIDRVIGLYVLFLVASVAALVTGIISTDVEAVRILVQATLWCTVIGAIFILALVTPGFTQGRLSGRLRELPRVGPLFGRLLEAIRMYRTRPGVLILTSVLSVFVHVLNTIAVYLIARGLPGEVPSLGAHFIIVSLAMLAGAIPLLPAGLGQFEGAMDALYSVVPGGAEVPPEEGLFVAFGWRAITITIAIVGVIFYIRGRRDVDAAWEEAEHMSDEDEAAEDKPLVASEDAKGSR